MIKSTTWKIMMLQNLIHSDFLMIAPYMGSKNNKPHDNHDECIAMQPKPKVKKPNSYRVLLLNDDYTPMDFVIFILERFFRKNREEATQIMLNVHRNGVGECGIYSYEIAETKVAQVMDCARHNQHPLQCVMEKK